MLLLILLLAGCQSGKVRYLDDVSFVSPEAGDSPEGLVLLNSKPCLDTDGQPGLCAVRTKTGSALSVDLPGRPYPYRLLLTCSDTVHFNGQYDVPASQPLSFVIPASAYTGVLSFTCIGQVTPQDRPDPVSFKFEFRAKVVSSAYVPRESIRVVKAGGVWFVYPGRYALHTLVLDQGEWRYYRKRTAIEVSGPDVTVTSESYQCRTNYHIPAQGTNEQSADTIETPDHG